MSHFVWKFSMALLVCGGSVAAGADLIDWKRDFQEARAIASQQKKLLLIHFWTPDCGPCKVIDRKVFPMPAVASAINENYVAVKVNAYQDPNGLRTHFGVERWPTDIVSTVDGRAIHRMVTPQDPTRYMNTLLAVSRQNASGFTKQPTMIAQQSASPSSQGGFPSQQRVQQNSVAQSRWANNIQAPDLTDAGIGARRPGTDPSMQPGVGVSKPGPGYTGLGAKPSFGQDEPQMSVPSRYSQPASSNVVASQTPAPAAQQAAPTEVFNRYAQVSGSTVGANQAPQSAGPQFVQPPAMQGSNPAINQVASPVAPAVAPPQQQPVQQQRTQPQFAAQQRQQQQPQQPVAQQVRPRADVTPVRETPPVGLDGRCPVTLVTAGKWRQGDPQWGAIHRGKLYLFAGAEQQKAFLGDPDLYSPVLAGMDVVRLAADGAVVQGTRRYGILFDDDGVGPRKSRIYLFDSVDSRNRFESDPDSYLRPVMNAMQSGTLDTLLR